MDRFKNQKSLIIAMGIVLIFLLVQANYYLTGYNDNEEIKQISIVAYGSETERWDNFKQGASVACDSSNAEVFLVTAGKDAGASEQAELIEREIENGADSVIVLASTSNELQSELSNRHIGKPVVFAETGIGEDYITADNYELGAALGRKIIDYEKAWVKVAIVTDNLERNSVNERYQGVYDTVEPYAKSVVTWDRNSNEKNMLTRKYLQRWLVEEAVDVIVTLDSETTDSLMDALDNLNKESKVYSIANTDKAVSYLDHGKIKVLEYQDEFAMGYIAATQILGKMELATPELKSDEVVARVITKKEMYLDENQKILFPFAK